MEGGTSTAVEVQDLAMCTDYVKEKMAGTYQILLPILKKSVGTRKYRQIRTAIQRAPLGTANGKFKVSGDVVSKKSVAKTVHDIVTELDLAVVAKFVNWVENAYRAILSSSPYV